MNLTKWRIAQAVERGDHAAAEELARTPEERAYARAMIDADRRLRAQASGVRIAAPGDLGPRIIDSVWELERERLRRGRSAARMPAGWLPRLAVAAGVCIVGAVMMFVMGPEAPPALVPGDEGGSVVAQAPEEVTPVEPVTRDPGGAIVPAGRLMVQRVETPLLQEAELLRRDTQRVTELVISSLPFGGGAR